MISETIKETERFLKALKAFKPSEDYAFTANKSRAAVKRASMDLSRKLTELRQASSDNWN